MLLRMNSAPKPSTKSSLTMKTDSGFTSVSAKVSSAALSSDTPRTRDSGDRHQRQKK